MICRYLNARGGGTMYGEGEDFRLLAREGLAEGIMDSSLLVAYENRLRP